MTHRRFNSIWLLAIFASLSTLHCGSSSASNLTVQPGERIQDKLDQLQAGDTLFVRAGTYTESLTFQRSGTPGQPLVVMAWPGESPVVTTASTVLSLDARHIVIDGLTFDLQDAASDAVKIEDGAAFCIIRNCEFRNGKKDGIDISGGASDLLIENNRIYDFFRNGVDAHGIVTNPGVERLEIVGNTIYDCSGDAIQLYAEDTHPVSEYSRDVTVRGNRFYTTLGDDSENALDFKGVDGCVVEENEMYGFANKAFVIQKGCRNIRIERNVIHDSQRGLEMRGEAGKSQKNMIIRKNIIYNIEDFYAVKFDWVDSVEFVNNTVAFSGDAAIRVEEQGVTNAVFKNNLFYKTGKPKIKGTFQAELGHNGWFETESGDMSSATDVNGTSPGFLDESAPDFRLSANSPAVDVGTDVGLPYQGARPDLGALEIGETPTPVRVFGFLGRAEGRDVLLEWQLAGSGSYGGFVIARRLTSGEFADVHTLVSETGRAGERVFTYRDRHVPPGPLEYRLYLLDATAGRVAAGSLALQGPLPATAQLETGWPNPFSVSQHGSASVRVVLPKSGPAAVTIYNILGQVVRRVHAGVLSGGSHVLRWDGKTGDGTAAGAGVYIYEMISDGTRQTLPLVVMK